MTNSWSDERWRLAEALALERLHGPEASRFIAERIAALALAGDHAGVERMHEIARAFDRLLQPDRPSH